MDEIEEEIKVLENRLREAKEKLERKRKEERIEFLKTAIKEVESELQVPSNLEVREQEQGNEALNNSKRPRLEDISSDRVEISTVSTGLKSDETPDMCTTAGQELVAGGSSQALGSEGIAAVYQGGCTLTQTFGSGRSTAVYPGVTQAFGYKGHPAVYRDGFPVSQAFGYKGSPAVYRGGFPVSQAFGSRR